MNIENPRVAIIGLGFGAEFIPIYQRHPNAEIVALCQRNEDSLNKVADQYSIAKRFTDYSELLADPEIDAVHINTPDTLTMRKPPCRQCVRESMSPVPYPWQPQSRIARPSSNSLPRAA